MRHLLESYTDYLSSNPGEFTSLILWLITTTIVYVVLTVYRKMMIHGATGANGFMESAEQVIYIINWIWPPILNYAAFFRNDIWVWYFMSGCIAWSLGGRWLFEWALALRAGSTKVESKTETLSESKTEVKQETKT